MWPFTDFMRTVYFDFRQRLIIPCTLNIFFSHLPKKTWISLFFKHRYLTYYHIRLLCKSKSLTPSRCFLSLCLISVVPVSCCLFPRVLRLSLLLLSLSLLLPFVVGDEKHYFLELYKPKRPLPGFWQTLIRDDALVARPYKLY